MTSLYQQLLKGAVDFNLPQILGNAYKVQKSTKNFTGSVRPNLYQLLFPPDNPRAKGVFPLTKKIHRN